MLKERQTWKGREVGFRFLWRRYGQPGRWQRLHWVPGGDKPAELSRVEAGTKGGRGVCDSWSCRPHRVLGRDPESQHPAGLPEHTDCTEPGFCTERAAELSSDPGCKIAAQMACPYTHPAVPGPTLEMARRAPSSCNVPPAPSTGDVCPRAPSRGERALIPAQGRGGRALSELGGQTLVTHTNLIQIA